jgi:phospholipase C
VEQTLNALTANPAVWSKTVLLVMFDENDGFFDHLPPPAAPSLNRDGSEAGASTCDVSAERFTHPAPAGTSGQPKPDGGVYGLGPRVPMLVLSPWSRGGWVNSQVFDHTSVIRFLESRFGVVETNISAWRRTVAGDLSSAFNFVNPNNEPLPSLPLLTKEAVDALRAQQEALPKVKVPGVDQQSLPVQPAGTRPSRALPYALAADATPDAAGHGLLLDFVNAGDVGAVFHVYDRLHLNRKPRRYTVGAGQRLQGRWDLRASAGRYDLWVLGPNGWHRAFVGSLARRASVPVVEARVAPGPAAARSCRSRCRTWAAWRPPCASPRWPTAPTGPGCSRCRRAAASAGTRAWPAPRAGTTCSSPSSSWTAGAAAPPAAWRTASTASATR